MAVPSNPLSTLGARIMSNAAGITPTPMRRIEHNDRINDVIDRRVRSAPSNILKRSFGFERFGTRVWTGKPFELIALGTTVFLRQCDQNFEKYRNPLAGCIDVLRFGPVGVSLNNSRMNSGTNSNFSGIQPLLISGDCSCAFNKISIKDSPLGYDMYVDALFVISFGRDLTPENSHRELEVMIARCMMV